ncbi:hypothetical protein [Ruegeria sp. R14_0]|uniref:hypothetical protein n=1 Tax=Ruegeria sp. R14_0 TaxID=2821100 RepID=UPI001FFDF0ED|nr:hypothetical protein [Ruegeria sp. R14_0]
MVDELVALTVTPLGLVILALSVVAFKTRRRILKWATAAFWFLASITVAANYYGPVLDDVRWEAMREGCIGSPLLFVGLAIAICATLIHGALRPRN